MLNIIGLSLSFIGAIVTVLDVIFSKPNVNGITWNEVENVGKNKMKSRKYTIGGLSIMAIGFAFQLLAAI